MLQNFRPTIPFSVVSCIFLFFSFLISLTSLAKKIGDKKPVFSRTIVLHDIYQRLEIWGNIEIVLTPEMSDSITVEGTTVDINLVAVKLKNGTLSVRAKWVNQPTTTKIIVPAAMLSSIQVYGNSVISSQGELSAPDLKVYLDGEAQVKIKSRGLVDVEASEGYFLTRDASRIPTSVRAKILTRAEDFYWGSAQVATE
ncbi:MAG: DUF2807 domain-containing protein [Bacteroidetes bacterium]|nr:DUF2807 domain-containing protein [Bacteroidota bacterium]